MANQYAADGFISTISPLSNSLYSRVIDDTVSVTLLLCHFSLRFRTVPIFCRGGLLPYIIPYDDLRDCFHPDDDNWDKDMRTGRMMMIGIRIFGAD